MRYAHAASASSLFPTVRWKEGGLMQYGNRVPDPVCGQCKKKLAMAVLTEAVYQDGIWWHTACHRVDTDQRLRATPLSEVLPAINRFIESQIPGALCSILRLKGDQLWHASAERLPAWMARGLATRCPRRRCDGLGAHGHRHGAGARTRRRGCNPRTRGVDAHTGSRDTTCSCMRRAALPPVQEEVPKK